MKTKHASEKIKFKLFEGIVGRARGGADVDICWFVSNLPQAASWRKSSLIARVCIAHTAPASQRSKLATQLSSSLVSFTAFSFATA